MLVTSRNQDTTSRGLHTDAGIGTASGDDAGGGSTGQGGLVFADTGEVRDIAGSAGGDSILDTGQSAGRDVREGLSRGEGNDGQTSESVLHFGGWGWLLRY